MSKKNLIKSIPSRTAPPIIDIEKAENLIAEAPPTTITSSKIETTTSKSSEEKIRPFMLRFPEQLHRKTKFAAFQSGIEGGMRAWILEAISEKLDRENYFE